MSPNSTSALHFLVVDDDDDARAATVDYLKALGYDRITIAKDGAEAARILDRDTSVNFVISDWQMPKMDGLGLLQHVRSSADKSQLPFLIVTSPVSQETEKIVLAAENLVNAYVIKPFRSDTLKQKIDKLLEMSVYGPQKRVVIVDDDSDARTMVTEYVQNLGFRDVCALADGRAALTHLVENRDQVGLIISDWEMPEMTGIELLRACRANPALADIPFLMITSQESVERMKVLQAARANVDQYLLKPFNGGELKKKIDDLMNKCRHRRETAAFIKDAAEHLEYGHLKKAQECYEKALKIDATNDVALRGVGDVLLRSKGVDVALAYYKKAVEANPLSARGCLKLASAYEQIGLVEKAISLLEIANRQIGFSAELHFNLGRLYNKKGHLEAAKKEFEKTLEIQLDHKEARVMLEMLGVGRKK